MDFELELFGIDFDLDAINTMLEVAGSGAGASTAIAATVTVDSGGAASLVGSQVSITTSEISQAVSAAGGSNAAVELAQTINNQNISVVLENATVTVTNSAGTLVDPLVSASQGAAGATLESINATANTIVTNPAPLVTQAPVNLTNVSTPTVNLTNDPTQRVVTVSQGQAQTTQTNFQEVNPRPRPSTFQKIMKIAGKILFVHACASMAAAVIYRLYSALQNERSIMSQGVSATFATEETATKTIPTKDGDSAVVKFVKWSINTYDPIAKFYNYKGQISDIFGGVGDLFNDTDEEKFTNEILGTSFSEFAGDFFQGLALEAKGANTEGDNPDLNKKEYIYSTLGAFLRELPRYPTLNCTLIGSESAPGISFNDSLDSTDIFNTAGLHQGTPGIHAVSELLSFLSQEAGLTVKQANGKVSITFPKNHTLFQKIEEIKGKKGTAPNVKLLIPAGFCESGATKTIDEALLGVIDAKAAKKLVTLNKLRDSSCEEGTCGALRVEVGLPKPPNDICLDVEYKVEFFPAPQAFRPKEGVFNDLISIVLHEDQDKSTGKIKQDYLAARMNPFDGAIGHNIGEYPVYPFLLENYSKIELDTYKGSILNEQAESLKIKSVNSNVFHGNCSQVKRPLFPSGIAIKSGTFYGDTADEAKNAANNFLNSYYSLYTGSGYLDRYIERVGPTQPSLTLDTFEVGRIFTKNTTSGVDNFITGLQAAQQLSFSNIGDERFNYYLGGYGTSNINRTLLSSTMAVGPGPSFFGTGINISVAQQNAQNLKSLYESANNLTLFTTTTLSDCPSSQSSSSSSSVSCATGIYPFDVQLPLATSYSGANNLINQKFLSCYPNCSVTSGIGCLFNTGIQYQVGYDYSVGLTHKVGTEVLSFSEYTFNSGVGIWRSPNFDLTVTKGNCDSDLIDYVLTPKTLGTQFCGPAGPPTSFCQYPVVYNTGCLVDFTAQAAESLFYCIYTSEDTSKLFQAPPTLLSHAFTPYEIYTEGNNDPYIIRFNNLYIGSVSNDSVLNYNGTLTVNSCPTSLITLGFGRETNQIVSNMKFKVEWTPDGGMTYVKYTPNDVSVVFSSAQEAQDFVEDTATWQGLVDLGFQSYLSANNIICNVSQFTKSYGNLFVVGPVITEDTLQEIWTIGNEQSTATVPATYESVSCMQGGGGGGGEIQPYICTYTLNTNTAVYIREYKLQKTQQTWTSSASIDLAVDKYEICLKKMPYKRKVMDQNGKEVDVEGEYEYTYPAGTLKTYFETGGGSQSFLPKTGNLQQDVTVPVKASYSFTTAFQQINPNAPLHPVFIGAVPLINLRVAGQRTATYTLERIPAFAKLESGTRATGLPSSLENNFGGTPLGRGVSFEDAIQIIEKRILNNNPSANSISSYFSGDLNSGNSKEITVYWNEDIRKCRCNSDSNTDFANNLYYGESYFMKVKRIITLKGLVGLNRGSCTIVATDPDGAISDKGLTTQVLEYEDVKYITFSNCASSSKTKFIRLQLR